MARKFRFTLETVLRVRKAKEEKVQLEYAALLDKRVRELNELGRLERGREDLNQAEAGARPAKVFAGDVRQYELARLALGEK